MKKRFTAYDLVAIGMMAAVCFAATSFFKIGPIPTPAGPTMVKLGNGFCLLAGMLLGGTSGGLAAGIGCMFYDLTDPAFVSSAPFTLVFYFLMALVCGKIAHAGGAQGKLLSRNILAGTVGALTYLVLHIGKSLIVLMLEGSGFQAALVTCATKLVTSGINAVVGVVVAVLLAPALHTALERSGFYGKISVGRHQHADA